MKRWGVSVMTIRGHRYTAWFDDPECVTAFMIDFQAALVEWQFITEDITAKVSPPNVPEIPHEWRT